MAWIGWLRLLLKKRNNLLGTDRQLLPAEMFWGQRNLVKYERRIHGGPLGHFWFQISWLRGRGRLETETGAALLAAWPERQALDLWEACNIIFILKTL
jgi:hypothetical protein